jgi:hypothetical protein
VISTGMVRSTPLLASVIALAACGSSSPAAHGPASSRGGSCPGADRVVITQWVDADGTAPGWRAYLANKSMTADERDAGRDAPPYQAISEDEARAGGVAVLPATVWIYTADRPPCRATMARPFRSIMNEGPVSQQIGVELTGCERPAKNMPTISFGLIGDGDLSGCTWTLAEDVALRQGDVSDEGAWQAPTKETAIPAEVTPHVRSKACAAPGCQHLWHVQRAGAADHALAYDVVQTWLTPDAKETACNLAHDDAAEILVRQAGGLARLDLAEDSNNMELVGVFSDGGGVRLAVLEDAGVFEVYAVGATARRAVFKRWFDANEEDGNYRSMAPYCGP